MGQENRIEWLAFKVRESKREYEHWQELHRQAIRSLGKTGIENAESE